MQTENTLRTPIQLEMNSFSDTKPLRNLSHNQKQLETSQLSSTKYVSTKLGGGMTTCSKMSPNNDTASTKEDNSSYLNEDSIFSNSLFTPLGSQNEIQNIQNNRQTNVQDFQKDGGFNYPMKARISDISSLTQQLQNTNLESTLRDASSCSQSFINLKRGTQMTQANSHQSDKVPSPNLNPLIPIDQKMGRRRFYSSIHDLGGQIQTETLQYCEGHYEMASNNSTTLSNFSALENGEISEAQKKREQEVLTKISKIWTDMSILKQECMSRQALKAKASKVIQLQTETAPVTKINISSDLGMETTISGGSLFMIHQQNQRSNNIKKMEQVLTKKINNSIVPGQNKLTALADMIMNQLEVQPKQEVLTLQPQFSSDFLSFSSLQKEIDETCLGKQFSLNNQTISNGI